MGGAKVNRNPSHLERIPDKQAGIRMVRKDVGLVIVVGTVAVVDGVRFFKAF